MIGSYYYAAPYGIYLHGNWLSAEREQVLVDFFKWVVQYPGVIFATPSQIIAWMQKPCRHQDIGSTLPEFNVVRPPTVASPEVCDGIDNNLNDEIDEGLVNYCPFEFWSFSTCAECPSTYPSITNVPPGRDTRVWYLNPLAFAGIGAGGGVFIALVAALGCFIHKRRYVIFINDFLMIV